MKNFIIITLIIVALIGGGAFLKKNKAAAPGSGSPTHNVLGKGTSGVTLVQYGDFQCPGCGQFYPLLKQVIDHYKDEITFQFVNFPLVQIHQNAQAAARAGQAAANQGKFWQMHDLLYQGQPAWSQASDAAAQFETYASQLGLDVTKYRKDFASADTNAAIKADVKTGQNLKVTGTPTFFLDGKQIEDNNTVSTPAKFEALIDAEILAKTGKPSTSKAAAAPATTAAPATP